MVLACQSMMFLFFWHASKGNRKVFFITFAVSAAIIIVSYLPWVPYLIQIGNAKSFWAGMPGQDFYFGYFNEYFGNAAFVYIFLYIFLIVYIVNVSQEFSRTSDVKRNPLIFSFIFIFFSVFFGYMVPYAKSLFTIPMIISRYTMIVLPSLILGIAYGVYLIKAPAVRHLLLGAFLFLSLFDLLFIKRYYSTPEKQQFREITELLYNQKTHYPVINGLTGWQQSYYLDRYKYKGKLYNTQKEVVIDDILSKKTSEYAAIDTFWLVGMHGEPHLDSTSAVNLDTAFSLLYQQEFIGGWAQLYGQRKKE
jgi:hypothetical protein